MNFDVDVENKNLDAIVNITIQVNNEQKRQKLIFLFFIIFINFFFTQKKKKSTIKLNALYFDKVLVESEKKIKWRYTGEFIFVTFLDELQKNEKVQISVKYTINSPTLGILYGGPSKEYPNEAYYFASDNETGLKFLLLRFYFFFIFIYFQEKSRYWIPTIGIFFFNFCFFIKYFFFFCFFIKFFC